MISTLKYSSFFFSLIKAFDFFELESDDCSLDFVEVYNGSSQSDDLLGVFCGKNIPFSVTSTGHRMLVVFKSDSSVVSKGFTATYTKGK